MHNTSYEDAQNVRISFYSNTLKLLSGTYDEPGNSGKSLTINDAFRSDEIIVSTLAQGRRFELMTFQPNAALLLKCFSFDYKST